MNCTSCGKPLSNRLDTFGSVGGELCQRCYLSKVQDYARPDACPKCGEMTLYADYEAELFICHSCKAQLRFLIVRDDNRVTSKQVSA